MSNQPETLLSKVRESLRLRHYSIRTEQAYIAWIRRYILFHDMKHPRQMGRPEIEAFLSHLATELKVSASTQNQAFSAILFLYRFVLKKNTVFEEQEPGALETMLKINEELDELMAEGTKDLQQKPPDFLTNVRQDILKCLDIERKAFKTLSSIVGEGTD